MRFKETVFLCPICNDRNGRAVECRKDGVCPQCLLHAQIAHDDFIRLAQPGPTVKVNMTCQLFKADNWDLPTSSFESQDVEYVTKFFIAWLQQWRRPKLKQSGSNLLKSVDLVTLEVKHV